MTGSWGWDLLIGIVVALLVAWLALIATLAIVVVTMVLRSVVRRAGLEAVRRHWPGTDDGLAALTRLTGLDKPRA
ncbi:hypothetical protein AB0K05_12705 [Nonomuraea sp. NPDC049486]|uniref:hypothetical protein n=1 Tax=Nonomuraea sp. NPDC049486 TaxID=3155773 RepID=UPI00341D5289